VRDRINDAGAVAVITTDEQCRGGKHLPLKPAVDEAIAMGGCESIKNVFVYERTASPYAKEAGRTCLSPSCWPVNRPIARPCP